MASYADEEEDKVMRRFGWIVKRWIGCLVSFTLSLLGGLILTCWEFKYHPTNDQQWMVPLGLILFLTPLIICFALSISHSNSDSDSDPLR